MTAFLIRVFADFILIRLVASVVMEAVEVFMNHKHLKLIYFINEFEVFVAPDELKV